MGEIVAMKKPTPTEQADRRRIAVEGAKAAQKKFAKSRRQIERGMKLIEADIEKNDGEEKDILYPFAGGRITIAEVLRRSGKSEAYLRKADRQPALADLKREIEAFVDRANALILKGAPSIRRAVSDRVNDANDNVRQIKQAWAEAELEHNETLNKLAKAEKTIEYLTAENASLLKKLAGKTVVDLDTRRK